MKLKEIIEANMYPVDHYEPSGNGGATSVDPDEVDKMLDPNGKRYSKLEKRQKADRSKGLRNEIKMAKNGRAGPKSGGKVVSDNTDLTGAGADFKNGPMM